MFRPIFLILMMLSLPCVGVLGETVSFVHQGMPFKLVRPKGITPRPLLLLLHGCKQSSEIIIQGTGLDQEAEKRGFYLLVPEQTIGMNPDRCWNWFLSQQQTRGGLNEMSKMIGAIELMAKTHAIDKHRLFVAGLSAGGAMAHNLVSCYPDYFKGGAMHSGLAYKTAENIFEAQAVLTAASQKNPDYLGGRAFACAQKANHPSVLKRLLILHGSKDPRVKSLHADLIAATNSVVADLLDDKQRNNSDTPAVYEQTIPFPNGYKAFITDRRYKAFDERQVLIEGLPHAWGAGKPISANFDPPAPSSNQFILNFFNL